MATKNRKKEFEIPEVGSWVRLKKAFWDAPKGTIALLSEVIDGDVVYEEETLYTLSYQNSDGETDQFELQESNLESLIEEISEPEYIVAWSTQDVDPLCYFPTLKEAKSFKDKILKRKKSYEKVIESGIYKRVS